jgi:hypothetical protein
LEYLQAVHLGHVQVEQHQVGRRGWLAIREVALAKQVINRLDAVVNNIHRAVDIRPA